MPRPAKIILIIVGIVIAVVVAAAIALPFLINPNDFKGDITAAVQDKTGRTLTLSGDITLSVFPWLGVRIDHASLADAKGFGDKPFAEIKTVDVRVKLLPLLRKHIEIGTLALDGLRLRLARKANGQTNWDDLVKAFASDDDSKDAEPPKKTESGFTLPKFEIGAIEISDAAISWHDAQNKQNYDLTNFKLSTGRLTLDAPFRLESAFDVSDGTGLTAHTNFVTQAQLDLAGQFYRLKGISLNIIAKGKAIPGGEQQLALTGAAEVDMQAGRLKVSDLMLQAAGITVTGNVDGNHLTAKSPDFNGRITIKEFNPRAVMKRLNIQPPQTAKASALTSAGLDAQFEGSLNQAALKQVLIQIDDSTLKGDAKIKNFSKPAITFKLGLDHMNVDDYLPPKSKAKPQTPAQATSAEITLDPIKNLTLDGRVTADKLTVSNLKIDKAELAVTANDGVLSIRPLGANLYGGSLRMQGKVDAASKRPSYVIHGDLDGLQFGPLLKDFAGSDKLNGLANLKLDLTTAGDTVEAMKKSLDGTISFEFQNGTFTGFNLARLLEVARTNFLGKKAEPETSGETPFSRFAASFSVNDGVMAGKNLTLNAKALKAEGSGDYNIVTDTLQYIVNVVVPKGTTDIKGLRELQGITVPIKLTGKLLTPDYSIDMAGALKSVAQQKLQEEKAKVEEKVQGKIDEKKKELNEKVQEKLQKGLSNLFGDKNKSEEPAPEPAK